MNTLHRCTLAAVAVLTSASLHAQISLQSAVGLALKNSPRVRSAQADLDKASAARSEAKDAYIPVISTTFGYGLATGAPLNVPIIFSISSQSLIFSYSQKDYIRSTEQSVLAAEHALHAVEIEITEDASNTYLALDNATERKAVLTEELGFADRLVRISSERIDAGVDAKVELPKSRRTATQIRLLSLQVDDEIAQQRAHLATLTGLPASSLRTDHSSIPPFTLPAATAQDSDKIADSEGIQASFATARAKLFQAFGDQRYLLRPQVSLSANYSRVATGLSSYAAYYPRYAGTADNPNSENALSFGLGFTIPLLDMAHRSKARQSEAEAKKAFADAEQQRGVFREGRAKLQNATTELNLRTELARDDREIAQDQLDALRLQLQANAANVGATPANPKDELNAQLQERQKYADVLAAELQLQQTQINLLRQTEGLGSWILHPNNGSNPNLTITPRLPGAAPPTQGAPPPPSSTLPAAPQPAPGR